MFTNWTLLNSLYLILVVVPCSVLGVKLLMAVMVWFDTRYLDSQIDQIEETVNRLSYPVKLHLSHTTIRLIIDHYERQKPGYVPSDTVEFIVIQAYKSVVR